ncbi:MAG: hypothetical protein R3D03_13055 [Geminicoccaceae bacterium]
MHTDMSTLAGSVLKAWAEGRQPVVDDPGHADERLDMLMQQQVELRQELSSMNSMMREILDAMRECDRPREEGGTHSREPSTPDMSFEARMARVGTLDPADWQKRGPVQAERPKEGEPADKPGVITRFFWK